MDDPCKDCEAQALLRSLMTRRSFLGLATTSIAVAAIDPLGVLAKKKCKHGTMTVVRKVNGKKKKVKICRPAPKKTPTPTPSATPPPSVQVATDQAPIYAGPGNVDFPQSTGVARGASVEVTGTYGDFVRVAYTAPNTASVVGYMATADLDALPPGVPALTAADVPWVTRTAISSNQPLHLGDEHFADAPITLGEFYYGVSGTALHADGDIRLDLSMEIELEVGADLSKDITALLFGTGLGYGSDKLPRDQVVRLLLSRIQSEPPSYSGKRISRFRTAVQSASPCSGESGRFDPWKPRSA